MLAGREVPAVVLTKLCEDENMVELWLQGEYDNEELCRLITKCMADVRCIATIIIV